MNTPLRGGSMSTPLVRGLDEHPTMQRYENIL